MPTTSSHRRVDPAGLARLREPRRDLLHEVTDDGVTFRQDVGPFRRYQRRLVIGAPSSAGEDPRTGPAAPDQAPDATTEQVEVVEEIEFELAIPVWRHLFTPLMARALRSDDRTPRRRWWWSREVVTTETATLIGLLVVLSVIGGYLGTVISQTITFAAAQFDAGRTAQGNTLAAVRIGVVLSVVAAGLADRFGRRPVILGTAAASAVLTALGALAQDLWTLGAAQTAARGLATALATLLVIAATEEVPAAVRALAVSLLTLGSALGSGMVVWVLPVADLDPDAWRVVYVVPLLSLPVLLWVHRRMPETRRFRAVRHDDGPVHVDRGRFVLLAVAAFAGAFFLSPASQFSNEFLREEREYSAAAISAFRLLTSTPAGLAVLLGGVVADRRGRRYLGAFGMVAGAGATALSYHSHGSALWLWALVGTWLLAAGGPALRVYQTELFPTRARGKVGGWLDLIAMSGSACGLVLVGVLADRWGSLSGAVSFLVVGPLVVAFLLLARFPETRSVELEVLNPGDPRLSGTPASAGPPPAPPGPVASGRGRRRPATRPRPDR